MRNKLASRYGAVSETIKKRDCYAIGSVEWEELDYLKSTLLRKTLSQVPKSDVLAIEKLSLKQFIKNYVHEGIMERQSPRIDFHRFERIVEHPKFVRVELMVEQVSNGAVRSVPIEMRAKAVNTEHLIELLFSEIGFSKEQISFIELRFENNVLYIVYRAL